MTHSFTALKPIAVDPLSFFTNRPQKIFDSECGFEVRDTGSGLVSHLLLSSI